MLPLAGITVISIEQAVAAPFASRQLADFGARVIKVERPGTGDFARDYDGNVQGLSSWFVWLNRSKESLTLDLKHPDAQSILERLLRRADVLIHNLAPGAPERLGLASTSLNAKYPGLIVCEISGYGPAGPYSGKKAYDLVVQNETGLVSLTGTPDGPAKAGISAADIAAGMYAFTGILLALRTREQTGRGGVLQVSLFDSLGEWLMPAAYTAAFSGHPPLRSGTEHASIAPYGPFECADGRWIVVAVQNEREWARFCSQVLAQPELVSDARFRTNSLRSQNREPLRAIVAAVLRTMSETQAAERLDRAEIAHGNVNSVDDFWKHPQHGARGQWREVDSPAGPLPALLPPINLAGVDPRMDPVPGLGQHTERILAELGYSAESIESLHALGAV